MRLGNERDGQHLPLITVRHAFRQEPDGDIGPREAPLRLRIVPHPLRKRPVELVGEIVEQPVEQRQLVGKMVQQTALADASRL
ncbi:hypothetical protein D9M69_665300 [compost metagenome]